MANFTVKFQFNLCEVILGLLNNFKHIKNKENDSIKNLLIKGRQAKWVIFYNIHS